MMDLSQRKQQFSLAYVRAVATVAGFTVYQPEVDDESIDLGISGRVDDDLPCPPRIELQLKCTSERLNQADPLVYRLKLKNYNDLRLAEPLVPRILVVMFVPEDVSEWLGQTNDQLTLRRCAYWISLRGLDETRIRSKVQVRLTRENIFSPLALRELMRKASRRELL
jgi:hypothetical protein